MASKLLGNLKAVQLKNAAFLCGLPSTGIKADLVAVLQRQARSSAEQLDRRRIVSVDMGLRNLAYCVVEVPGIDGSPELDKGERPLKVLQWKKTDLLRVAEAQVPTDALVNIDSLTKSRTKKRGRTAAVPASMFTPSELSKTAYSVTTELLKHEPDVILIERQRFRSGGAAAIQEWTLTADTLASTPEDASAAVGTGRKRVQKNDKIAVVRSWLGDEAGSSLTFEGGAARVANAFASPCGRSSRAKPADTELSDDIGKLDDLADCLLQAAAWARWEENRNALAQLLLTENG
ncbi:hypothetical protein LTR56_019734 [Elasticomyces elasticus]|nr:hypothetical protein LTR56_019734 [Elasticomyces elasticus]KAK3655802.1 hypothetical protein LTR22_010096 [Elasticomyces elasticus]KAK4925859.1 hypothetical protein LTR49_007236 [Elasticomyces elasticus]KAK5764813.1 hypothetical protein LTS12_005083 [Elasticomyces elasticus]